MYSKSYYITLLYVFTCLYNYIGIVLCTAYFVFVLTFLRPGLYRIYGNKDDDDAPLIFIYAWWLFFLVILL
jgi:hypothetical protein